MYTRSFLNVQKKPENAYTLVRVESPRDHCDSRLRYTDAHHSDTSG